MNLDCKASDDVIYNLVLINLLLSFRRAFMPWQLKKMLSPAQTVTPTRRSLRLLRGRAS